MKKPLTNSTLSISLILGILLIGLSAYLIVISIMEFREIKETSDLKTEQNILYNEVKETEKNIIKIMAFVTAFNTIVAQTDSTPCIAKFGYICGRDDVVACPRNIPPNTKAKILGKEYECMDWLSNKYPNRFDISFDKDLDGAIQWGKKYLEIIIYE